MLKRPNWLAEHVPALDGVRGWAIVLVLLHHCQPRLERLGLHRIAAWGWTGVDLFFVLSGFLITGIVLEGREQPRFFRNFYARRALRIWPVYALVVPVNFYIFGRANTWNGGGPFGLYFLLFIYNLMPGLTGTLYPAWSLAIEEQFYVVWAPIARRLPVAALAALLAAAIAISPWLRHDLGIPFPIHTLYHLDGLALGSLIALGVRCRNWTQQHWARLALGAVAVGAAVWWWADRSQGAALDTGVALVNGGVVLLAVSAPSSQAARWMMTLRPLRYLGKISYGLYLTHMLVFAYIGALDEHMDRIHAGAGGDLVIVLVRWTLAILVATALWYGFERPILKLKRYFPSCARSYTANVASAARSQV
ncbi:MAG TPA: acyltransferase [Terriglobales bacterium]|nr:acyltransferase [Terriglobales bacterium]